MNGEAKEPPMHADGRRYGTAEDGNTAPDTFDIWNFAMRDDGSVDMQLRTHDGRELAHCTIPVRAPQEEDITVVLSTRGKGRHSLQVDWIPITKMLGTWWWRWRWVRLELLTLWRMLRR